MTMIFACNIADATRFEFGGALKQELKLVKTSDSDVVAVVKVSIENSIMLTCLCNILRFQLLKDDNFHN